MIMFPLILIYILREALPNPEEKTIFNKIRKNDKWELIQRIATPNSLQ